MPLTYERGDNSIIIDDRYAPVFVASFIGNSDEDAAKWFMTNHVKLMLERVKRGEKVSSISDATHATAPTPDGRRAWANLLKDQDPRIKAASIANVVVITNALIRGAITAIGWMNEDVRSLTTVASMDEALAAVRAAHTRAGVRMPALPEKYALPPGTEVRAASGR